MDKLMFFSDGCIDVGPTFLLGRCVESHVSEAVVIKTSVKMLAILRNSINKVILRAFFNWACIFFENWKIDFEGESQLVQVARHLLSTDTIKDQFLDLLGRGLGSMSVWVCMCPPKKEKVDPNVNTIFYLEVKTFYKFA